MHQETFNALRLNSGLRVFEGDPRNIWPFPECEFWGAAYIYNNISTDGGYAQATQGAQFGLDKMGVAIISLNFCFTAYGGTPIKYLTFTFADRGGHLNLRVNHRFVHFNDFRDINGTVISGVRVRVSSTGVPGNNRGKVEFAGEMPEQTWFGHLAVGGQELFIDNWCWE